jgi:hypothetical protein
LDFYQPKLDSFFPYEVTESSLSNIAPVPFLFHSGYLTLDKKIIVPVPDLFTGGTINLPGYSFRFPNFEVSASYHADCIEVIFQLTRNECQALGTRLLKALTVRDATEVSSIFSQCLSTVSYLKRNRYEWAFHGIIKLILIGMGFKVLTELLGLDNGLDLSFELPNGDYVVIELKYVKGHHDLKPEEEILALAYAAKKVIPRKELYKCLADLAKLKLPPQETVQIGDNKDKDTRTELLADLALNSLSANDINQALAEFAKEKLSKETLTDHLLDFSPKLNLSGNQINNYLSKGVALALKALNEKNHHSVLANKANKIIDLGLAIYGVGNQVKAAFGPVESNTDSPDTP